MAEEQFFGMEESFPPDLVESILNPNIYRIRELSREYRDVSEKVYQDYLKYSPITKRELLSYLERRQSVMIYNYDSKRLNIRYYQYNRETGHYYEISAGGLVVTYNGTYDALIEERGFKSFTDPLLFKYDFEELQVKSVEDIVSEYNPDFDRVDLYSHYKILRRRDVKNEDAIEVAMNTHRIIIELLVRLKYSPLLYLYLDYIARAMRFKYNNFTMLRTYLDAYRHINGKNVFYPIDTKIYNFLNHFGPNWSRIINEMIQEIEEIFIHDLTED